MMMRTIAAMLCGLILLATPNGVAAQAYGTEFPFVLGAGARAAGMGNAGASLRGDASAQYYNPSALSYLEWKEFVFFRTTLFDADAVYHALSYAHPLMNYGTIGVTLLRLDVSQIEERDASNQLLSQDLHNSQTRLLLGYAKNVTSSVAAGFNLKIDNQSFGAFNGSGVGFDMGLSASQNAPANSFLRGFRQGLTIQNIVEPSIKLDQDKVSDPMQFRFGVSVLSAIRNTFMETTVDLVNPRFSPFRIQIGQEISYENLYSFRFGLDEEGAAFGLGARYKSVAIDYAYQKADIGNNHRFSLAVRFGPSVAQRKAEALAKLESELNTEIGERMTDLERTQIDRSLSRGDSLFAIGEYDKALGQFESTLLWEPNNEHAIHYVKKSRYHVAIEQSDEAVNRGDCAQGIFYAKQALDLFPNDTHALGIIDNCNQTLAHSRDREQLVHDLLNTSIDSYADRRYPQALSGFEEVVRLDPANKLALEYRKKCRLQIDETATRYVRDSRAAAQNGDYATAIDRLQQALKLRPNDTAIERQIAEFSRKLAEPPPAEQAAPSIPTQPAFRTELSSADLRALENKYNQGMELFNKGDLDQSVRLLGDVWSADPGFHDVSNLLTKAYVLMGMRLYSREYFSEAIDVWNRALAIDPHNAKVKRYLARAELERKKFNTVEE